MKSRSVITFLTLVYIACMSAPCCAGLMAGTAKVDVTDYEAGPVNDPLYVKALVLQSGDTRLAIVSVDAVAIGEIGRIKNDFLPKVRSEIENKTGIPAHHVLVNASHCHGVVKHDISQQTIQAVREAFHSMQEVRVGVGTDHEDRIGENRRLIMKDGREIDVRHAYSMPPDDEVASVGPIDPEIGVLKLDRLDGTTLCVLYNYACHPIQGVPSGANTADITGFSSTVIEQTLGDNSMAIFLQGCGGDINPVFYKDVKRPRDAQTLGNLLGLSVLKALQKIGVKQDERLVVIRETTRLPRSELSSRIDTMKLKQTELAQSLRGTTLNLKSFLPLVVQYRLSDEFPAYYSLGYLQEQALGREDLSTMDRRNREDIRKYIQNIQKMEELTRVNTNLSLLQKHHRQNLEAESREIEVELLGVRVGDFVLTSFPGELTVQIGLNLKEQSPHKHTFVAGYTNGYIYYAPTTKQLSNPDGAQEDCDCILAPHWQAIYEKKAIEILGRL